MSFKKFIGFKFFFLIWNYTRHFEEKSRFRRSLGLLWRVGMMLMMMMMVGIMEHIPVLRDGGGVGVLGGVSEGEHVKGGLGCTVQHPGTP